jgi:hypothetical protein
MMAFFTCQQQTSSSDAWQSAIQRAHEAAREVKRVERSPNGPSGAASSGHGVASRITVGVSPIPHVPCFSMHSNAFQ